MRILNSAVALAMLLPVSFACEGGGLSTTNPEDESLLEALWIVKRWDTRPSLGDATELCGVAVPLSSHVPTDSLCEDCELEWFVNPQASDGGCEGELDDLFSPHRVALIASALVSDFSSDIEEYPWAVFTDWRLSGYTAMSLYLRGAPADWAPDRSFSLYELEFSAFEEYQELEETWLSVGLQMGVDE